MEGCWLEDLERAIVNEVGEARAEHWGTPDLTKNIARSVIVQLSITYDRAPIIQHDDPAAVEQMEALLEGAGAWSIAGRMQRLCIAQRECALHMRSIDGVLTIQVVPADVLWAEAWPEAPDEPHTFRWYRRRPDWREDGDGEVWTVDVWSIKDPENPVYRIESNEDEPVDLTVHYLGAEFSGAAYPVVDGGRPVLPWVLYHAERTGKLWDAFEGIELFEGALKVALFWTFWGHIVKDASFPLKYAVNGVLGGTTASEHGPFVDVDPSVLLFVDPKVPGTPVSLGQFQAGGDPQELGTAIRDYSADLAVDFGISPSDIQRGGGDARSGYAIFLTREGVRAAQRRLDPQFRRGDKRMLSVAAAVHNSDPDAEGTLPTTGWDITHRGLPLSIEERKALMEESAAQIQAGIMSKVDLYALMNSTTLDQARAALTAKSTDFALFP